MVRRTSRRRTQRSNVHAVTGRTGVASRPYEQPGPPMPGQVRCPVCRKATTPLTSGFLRKHADLFGHPCYNRRPPEVMR